ncbi:MAG: SDR family NAD(P)-dependent oxidoreductase [Myxococcales bacterium]|nr:SDR family NAD(P)-dependent oxidoreductase [Myxococcales bacterium]
MSEASACRHVLVTGASRGIGRAVAEALLERGDRLAVVARDRAALEGLVAGGQHVVLPADLAKDEPRALVDRAADALGGLDALVSCAGIVEYAEVGAITRDALERQLAVNLVAPVLLAQRAARHMQRAGGGSIVLVSSTLATRPVPMTTAYAASKGGLEAATRTLALELGPANVRVNAVAPGVIDTDMVRVVRTRAGEATPTPKDARSRIDAQLAALRALHPRGRLGTPADVAESVLHLLDADYMTGTVVAVDGGLSLGEGKP